MEHQLILLLIGSLIHTNRDDFLGLSSQNLISFCLYSVEIFSVFRFVLEMETRQELVMEQILFCDRNQREPKNHKYTGNIIKGSLDSRHFIFEINVGKRRIRDRLRI